MCERERERDEQSQTWKVKMSMYLKSLEIHVYLVTIKDSYCLNGKHLEANTKVIHALKLP